MRARVQEGRIQVYGEGALSPLGCEEELGPVQEILAAGGGEEEPAILCLLASGRACKVSISPCFFLNKIWREPEFVESYILYKDLDPAILAIHGSGIRIEF